MPRILSRSELLPQVKPLHHHPWNSGSGWARRSGTHTVSPTISAFPSAAIAKSRCVGISYKIEEDRRRDGERRDTAESRGDDHDTWGYFVDFTSPQYVEERKSLPLLDRSEAPR